MSDTLIEAGSVTSFVEESKRTRRQVSVGLATVWVVIAITTVIRFTVGSSKPFWMDESWTGMIVTQPSLWDFVKQCFYDTNAPLYYIVAGVVGKFIGYSDFAMRLPAAVFGALAPVAALVVRLPGPRVVRYTWAVLLACWAPGLWYSQDARCYTLLVFLGVLNTSAFANLLEDNSNGRLRTWAVVSSLMILTHYFAAPLVAIQFAIVLLRNRRSWMIFWPGILFFIPAGAAIVVSASKFLLFTQNKVSWIHLVTVDNVFALVGSMLGSDYFSLVLIPWAIVCLLASLVFTATRGPKARENIPKAIWISFGVAASCVLISVAVGAIKPVVYANYLVPFVPGVLLGLSAAAAAYFVPAAFASGLLSAIFFLAALGWAKITPMGVHILNIERASERLMTFKPTRLVFLWDSPFMQALSRADGNYSSFQGLGGFFFARAGRPVTVDAVDLRLGEDPNPLLLERAKADGSAILWVYDHYVAGTSGIRYPPRIHSIDPRWNCEDFGGGGGVGIVACHKSPAEPVRSGS